MKKIFLFAACVSALTWYGCSKDDDDDDNGTNVNLTDRNFVMRASMSNTAEIDAGQTASSKATNAGIRDFGQMMVTDHTNAKATMSALASSLGIYAPDSLDAEHVALKAKLMSLSGRAFDSVYINSQVADHQTAINLFENEVQHGDNRQLTDLANNLLPTLRMHLHHADSLRVNY